MGPKPLHSSSLENHPACDDEVRALAEKVWGDREGKTITEHTHGKGKIVWGKSLPDTLQASGLQPDYEFTSGQKDPIVACTHRSAADAEIYFVANQRNRPEELQFTFRVSGKAPSCGCPETGQILQAAI